MLSNKDIFNAKLEQLKSLSGLDISINVNEASLEEDIEKISSLLDNFSNAPTKDKLFRQLLLGTKNYHELEPHIQRLNLRENDTFCLFNVFFHLPFNELAKNVLQSLFPSSKDCILEINKQHIAIIHRIAPTSVISDLAHTVSDILNTEAMVKVIVIYSDIENKLPKLNSIYEDNLLCLDIAKIFRPEQYVLSNKELGIGGLLYELPTKVCSRFLNEILKDNISFKIDEETRHTVDTFINNNLNIAETARSLHMHRNTLVYRIEQVEAKTGLDIRSFEGAMLFRLVSLIINFLHSKEVS